MLLAVCVAGTGALLQSAAVTLVIQGPHNDEGIVDADAEDDKHGHVRVVVEFDARCGRQAEGGKRREDDGEDRQGDGEGQAGLD